MFRLFKPRPPQGWRAVAWELAIVTIGVLIALTAQQWAEARSWSAKADAARQALGDEVANHHKTAVEWMVVAPCIHKQLDTIENRLLASASKLDPAPIFSEEYGEGAITFVIRTPTRPYDDSVWQATNGEGVSSFLEPDERLELGLLYNLARRLGRDNQELTEMESQLSVLSVPLELDPSVRLSLLQQVAAFRGKNRWMAIKASQLIEHIKKLQMGVSRSDMDAFIMQSGTIKFCRAQGLPTLPLAKALEPAS